jgi:AraC-like DNA-binding protein
MNDIISDDFVPKIYNNVFQIYQPEWQLRLYSVEHYDMTYIVSGKAKYTLDGTEHELVQGDLLCLTTGVKKTAITYPNTQMHCFTTNFDSLYQDDTAPPPAFPMVSHVGVRRDIIDMFKEMTISWSQQKTGYVVRTRALLMLILHHLAEILDKKIDKTTSDHRINKVIRTIAVQFADKLTVKTLAEQVHLDEAYLGHLFKKETGMTVHQHLKQVRIQNAENLLQSGNYKVHEVAELCGFSDVFYFYKSFRELRGFPPSKYMSRKLQF